MQDRPDQSVPDWAEPNVREYSIESKQTCGTGNVCKDGTCPPCNPDNPGDTPESVPLDGAGIEFLMIFVAVALGTYFLTDQTKEK